MASLNKSYKPKKLLGKVYTPRFVVDKILNDIGFDHLGVLGKTVLDPSCGDGRFLMALAERIIHLSGRDELIQNLEMIQGWDIDEQALELCRQNLNQLIKPFEMVVDWKVRICNSIREIGKPDVKKFDYIVGNPPYIRIQHLHESERSFIQQNYLFCKNGSTDAYIAFYELCNFLLSETGICGLITPNTYFYSQAAKPLRVFFALNKNLIKLTNYAQIQLFENATTYSAITIFGKQSQKHFLFEQAINQYEFEAKTMGFDQIKDKKFWQLSANDEKSTNGIKLKDICKIHVGITTLCDKAYIFPISQIDAQSDFVLVPTHFKGLVKLERAILKPIVKASKLKSGNQPIEQYVLFPYQKIDGKHKIIEEEKLKTQFPFAYHYLLSIKAELDKRDNGKPNPVAWYAFGRSQGLDTSFGEKILFSPMNHKPNFILLSQIDTTFYSGYCIKYEGDYNFLLDQLNSERLSDFIAVSSRDFRGGWKAYNKKTIEEFIIKPNKKSPLLNK